MDNEVRINIPSIQIIRKQREPSLGDLALCVAKITAAACLAGIVVDSLRQGQLGSFAIIACSLASFSYCAIDDMYYENTFAMPETSKLIENELPCCSIKKINLEVSEEPALEIPDAPQLEVPEAPPAPDDLQVVPQLVALPRHQRVSSVSSNLANSPKDTNAPVMTTERLKSITLRKVNLGLKNNQASAKEQQPLFSTEILREVKLKKAKDQIASNSSKVKQDNPPSKGGLGEAISKITLRREFIRDEEPEEEDGCDFS